MNEVKGSYFHLPRGFIYLQRIFKVRSKLRLCAPAIGTFHLKNVMEIILKHSPIVKLIYVLMDFKLLIFSLLLKGFQSTAIVELIITSNDIFRS